MSGLTAQQSQMYDLGRQARQAGFTSSACNISALDERRSAWLAGWHDEDIEALARLPVQGAESVN